MRLYLLSSSEFNTAEKATAEGLISTKEESHTDNSVIYRDMAYISSLEASFTCGGSNNSK
jgi:hypothetical protein